MERTRNHIKLTPDTERFLLRKLTEAELFEQFLGTRFLGAKRFSLEGAEGLVPLLELVIERAVGHGVKDIVIGMAHRGRLNVLANVVGKPAERDLRASSATAPPSSAGGGDVKYHLGYSGETATPEGAPVQLSLAFNPSHLECDQHGRRGHASAPSRIATATSRARRCCPSSSTATPPSPGQGIVAEGLNMSLPRGLHGGRDHPRRGQQPGRLHDLAARRALARFYATDVARMLQIPVFHVNGEDPEAVAQTRAPRGRLPAALPLRRRHRHVVLPQATGTTRATSRRFTQPVMYRAIAAEAVRARALRRAELVEKKVVSPRRRRGDRRLGAAAGWRRPTGVGRHRRHAERRHDRRRLGALPRRPRPATLDDVRTARRARAARPAWRRRSRPAGRLQRRTRSWRSCSTDAPRWRPGRRPVDWGMGEMLAFGTLAGEGVRVRLSGQDVAARHLQPPPRRALRPRDRRAVHAARRTCARARGLRGPRQLALRGGRARLRVRLQPRHARRPRRSGRRSSATSSTAPR